MHAHVLLLLLLAYSSVPSVHSVGYLPQNGAHPAQSFLFDMCAPPEPGQQQRPPWPVRVNDLCSSFGLNDPSKTAQACEVVSLLEMMLASPAAAPLQCQADAIPPPPSVDQHGVLLPLPLPDLRTGKLSRSSSSKIGAAATLPDILSPDLRAAMLRAEGPSHLWLYKHMQRFAAWSPCQVLGQQAPWQSPPGWQLLQLIDLANDLKPYKLNATLLPFAAVLRQDSSPRSRAACRRALDSKSPDHDAYLNTAQPGDPRGGGSEAAGVLRQHQLCSGDRLVVLLRGTASAYEWKYNLNYSMVAEPSYGQGQVHKGFLAAAEQVWSGGLERVLKQHAAAPGGVSQVLFAGHSLGGAVGGLLAAKTQLYLSTAAENNTSPTSPQPSKPAAGAAATEVPLVTAVMFGAPNVGDKAFAADFNARINARNIAFSADIVPQLPCAGHMPLCSSSSNLEEEDAESFDEGFEGDEDLGAWDSDATDADVDVFARISMYGLGHKTWATRFRRRFSTQASTYSRHSSSSSSSGTVHVSTQSDSSSSSSEDMESVSYVRLGGQLLLEAGDMPMQQAAWRQLSTYRQDDFCDNLLTMNALAQATHSCSYMCHLSASAGLDNSWCMLWPTAGQAGLKPNATFCQHGRSSLYPMTPPFPPML